jgi:hypothetical protein
MSTPAAPLLQSELQFKDQATPDTYFASRLISQMQRELSLRKRHMLAVVIKWQVAYDYVKMLEEEYFAATDPLRVQSQFFCGTVSVVRGLGTLLLAQLQSEDVDKLPSLGMTYHDLAACV